jgi:type II secretory pathway component PulK
MKITPMKANQHGSALIIVIWFIAIIGVIVTFLFYRNEVDWALVVNLEAKSHFTEIAEAVLHERLGLLVKDDTPEEDSPKDLWYGNGRLDLKQNGYQITIVIEDEGSKPNLNTISQTGLQLIIQNAQSSNSQSENEKKSPTDKEADQNSRFSLDPLLDWQDRDSEPRDDGAELNYYQGLDSPYKPRDGCFSSLEELKEVKDGIKLYSLLAPEVTVYGKVNPNTISGETFVNLLNSYGEYQKGWLDTVKDQFESYRADQKHFDQMDNLLRLNAITIGTLDKIKPLFQFKGSCNVNMATKIGLSVILKEAGYNDATITTVLNRRQAQPFESITDTYGLLGYSKVKGQVCPDDYLTITSTIIHYHIWVSKGSSRYYLDTIWERQMVGLKKEWQVAPLSFKELWNKDVPEIPRVVNADDEPEKNK